ncbi:MAG: YHS domain-containing (seleno)protein [Phormidesmis sp.]
MKISHQLISSYRVLSTARLMKALPKAMLAATAVLSVGLVACSSGTPSAGASGSESSVKTEAAADVEPADKVYLKDDVAIGGADPVAYFNGDLAKGEFVEGSAEFTHEWRGATWQFASAENRDAFAADPEKYEPQYGGYCAWAAAQNQLAAISPDAWAVVDGKLYLNANKNIQARWEKDIPGFITSANTNWPTLSMQ